MPKSIDYIVDDLNDRLRKSNKEVGTIVWSEAYKKYDVIRWKQARTDQIAELAMEKYNLVVSASDTVLMVAVNRNFSPI